MNDIMKEDSELKTSKLSVMPIENKKSKSKTTEILIIIVVIILLIIFVSAIVYIIFKNKSRKFQPIELHHAQNNN